MPCRTVRRTPRWESDRVVRLGLTGWLVMSEPPCSSLLQVRPCEPALVGISESEESQVFDLDLFCRFVLIGHLFLLDEEPSSPSPHSGPAGKNTKSGPHTLEPGVPTKSSGTDLISIDLGHTLLTTQMSPDWTCFWTCSLLFLVSAATCRVARVDPRGGARSLRRPQRRPGAITVITVEGGEHVAGL